MTVQSAAESLGLKWAVIDNLARRGLLALGPGGISAAEVERFRREYVLGSKLAHSMRTSPRHIAKLLGESGVTPVVGPGVNGSRQNVFRRAEIAVVLLNTAIMPSDP